MLVDFSVYLHALEVPFVPFSDMCDLYTSSRDWR